MKVNVLGVSENGLSCKMDRMPVEGALFGIDIHARPFVMPKKIPFRVTSYYTHESDHFSSHRHGWYTCNPGGCGCVCYNDKHHYGDDEDATDHSDEESSCFTTSIVSRPCDVTRYATTQSGERKAMTRCCYGNCSSMKEMAPRGLHVCQDAHYLVDGDTVIIDYLDAPGYMNPKQLRGSKHVRIRMSRGYGPGPAVGFRDFNGRDFKIEVDHAANVTLCKLKKPRRRRRPWEPLESDNSDDSASDLEEFEGAGPTPDQTTLYCNEFCRAVMHEAPRLSCFTAQV